MASGEKVGRSSQKEVSQSSIKDTKDAFISNQPGRNFDKSRKKRPERAIYRPGPVRQRGHHYSDNQNVEEQIDQQTLATNQPYPVHQTAHRWGPDSPQDDSVKQIQSRIQDLALLQSADMTYDSDEADRKKRSKRPDIKIYIPKAKNTEEAELSAKPGHAGGIEKSNESPGPTRRKVDVDQDPPINVQPGAQTNSPAANRQFVSRAESPHGARGRKNDQAQRGGRRGSLQGRGGHQGQHKDHSDIGRGRPREAEDAGRFAKPPRQGGRQGGSAGSSRGGEHRALRKANSLEWDDSSCQGNGGNQDRSHRVQLDTDAKKMFKEQDESENRTRRKRERRSSGPKERHDRWNSKSSQEPGRQPEPVPLMSVNVCANIQKQVTSKLQPAPRPESQPQPRVTTDETVEKSINKGTFEGLVFTNSRLDNEQGTEANSSTERQAGADSDKQKPPNAPQAQGYENRPANNRSSQKTAIGKPENSDSRNKPGKGDNKASVEATSDLPDISGTVRQRRLTWDEQVEEAEKLEEEENERQRISAVIQKQEKHVDHKREPGSNRQPNQRKDDGRASESQRDGHGAKSDRQGKGRDRSKPKETHRKPQSLPMTKPDERATKNLSLKVTFAGETERKVLISGDKNLENHERVTGVHASEDKLQPGPPRQHGPTRGGLIKLPTAAAVPHTNSGELRAHHPHPRQHLRQPQSHPHHPPARGGAILQRGQVRGRAQMRGGSHRTLYDPNNPSKTAHMSTSPKGLHFYDPTDPTQNSPPQNQAPFFSDQYSSTIYAGDYAVNTQGYYDHGYPPGGTSQGGMFYGMQPQRMPAPHIAQRAYDATEEGSHEQCYRSGYDQEPSRLSPNTRCKAEKVFKEMLSLDCQLCNLVSRGSCHPEVIQKIQTLRKSLQDLFDQVIHLDLELCNNHNLDQLVWKSSYYQVIEMLRKYLAEHENEDLKELLVSLLEEGTVFYENLLKDLQKTFNFNLEAFLDPNTPSPSTVSRMTKLALYIAQKALIFLGDIARYKEQVNQTANYGKARNWYLKAQTIAPKNGRPYNQLAILAMYTRRKLDAVYYYMRSLAASNPFITARESLMSLFDDARKRAEVSEKKRSQEIAQRKKLHQDQWKKSGGRSSSEKGQRVEIWISSDGSSLKDEVADNEDDWDNLLKMSAVELNKRFVVSFLNVHGKLFTKIGMETFPEVSSQMLHEFSALLNHSPSPIGNTRLLQLVTINMYAIENAAPKDEDRLEANCRTMHQELAVQLGLDMFGLLAEKCTQLLKTHLESGDIQILSEDLHCLIPSVKVWADWMTCHENRWNPPPLSRDPELGPKIDVWKAIASLCNIMKLVDITHVKIYSQKKEGCDPIILPEDAALGGFVPLLSLPESELFVHATFDKDVARDCTRVDKLRTFGDYLYGIEQPLLSYNAETREYVSIAPESYSTAADDANTATDQDVDVIVEGEYDEPGSDLNMSLGSSGDEDQIKQLRAKKEQLERKVAEREKHQQSIRNVLDDTDQYSNCTELEVRPQVLIPDTNGFIDHLVDIQTLLASKKYTIVVPLVVINELDGLAKGSKEGQYHTVEHAEMVYLGAKKAIGFLEATFENRTSHLKALTSKGSVLDTIAFRAEETSSEGNNDDLILSCCLHYCKDVARDFMPKSKSEPIKLFRDVVLLTDDRNLRLKAHTRNVPVKDIPQFMKWAKIG